VGLCSILVDSEKFLNVLWGVDIEVKMGCIDLDTLRFYEVMQRRVWCGFENSFTIRR
jgi:hypothetical protein